MNYYFLLYKNCIKGSLVNVSEKQKKYREKTAVCKNIKVGDSVWLFTSSVKPGQSKKHSKFNSGPYTITGKLNEVNFKISLQSNLKLIQIVHVDRLTKFKSRNEFFKTNQQHKNIDCESNGPSPTVTDTPSDFLARRTRRRDTFFSAD